MSDAEFEQLYTFLESGGAGVAECGGRAIEGCYASSYDTKRS